MENFYHFIFITTKLHARIHRYMYYVPGLALFQTRDFVLLDTREKHEQFIEEIKKLRERF